MGAAILETSLPGFSKEQKNRRGGKVRDIYDLGDCLLLVSTDRISAFDWVLPNGIPDKGRVLTDISKFWFEHLGGLHHFLSTDMQEIIRHLPTDTLRERFDRKAFAGRSMLVQKTQVMPIECVVRGYLEGSGWKEYQKDGTVCGIQLPPGLLQGSKLEQPIFTPATKEASGHDINITFERMVEIVGAERAEEARAKSLDLYTRGTAYALERGIIIADTKFEFGTIGDLLYIIDEVLTPDSSRFWPADEYQPGRSQPSFDKQFVRDWLSATGWDKNSPPPALPDDIVQKTRGKYIAACEKLTGEKFS